MTNSLIADGVELDSMAHWVGLDSNRWSVPGAKGENLLVPARHGSLWVADKTFSEGEFTLSIQVFGANPDGTVPLDQLSTCRQNIDKLLRIFTKRKSLIRFQQTLDNGAEVECYAECVGAFDITRTSAALPFAKMTVSFRVPGAFWQDTQLQTFTSDTGITQNEILSLPPFEGGTAPMDDGVYIVHGPITDPELYVYATGAFTRLGKTVPAGSKWRVNAANWTSVMGPNVTFTSQGDPSVIKDTVHGGSASLVDLPPLSPGDNAIEIGGINTGAATRLEVRGRRKYLIS